VGGGEKYKGEGGGSQILKEGDFHPGDYPSEGWERAQRKGWGGDTEEICRVVKLFERKNYRRNTKKGEGP